MYEGASPRAGYNILILLFFMNNGDMLSTIFWSISEQLAKGEENGTCHFVVSQDDTGQRVHHIVAMLMQSQIGKLAEYFLLQTVSFLNQFPSRCRKNQNLLLFLWLFQCSDLDLK